jgi:hypothetical protein
MREHRAAATTAGILYIIGTVAGVLSQVVAIAPVSGADDRLAAGVQHSGAVVTCALLVLVMGLSLAFVPVVLFPALREVDEVLAIGYLVVRGAVETTCYVVSAISLLLLVPVGEAMSTGTGTASPTGERLGNLLLDHVEVGAVTALVFCLGGVLFYLLLYRSRIVPRWIVMWGLAAIPFYAAAYVLAVYAVIGTDSTAQTLLYTPMVLAVWMIARGFRPAVLSPASEPRVLPRTSS